MDVQRDIAQRQAFGRRILERDRLQTQVTPCAAKVDFPLIRFRRLPQQLEYAFGRRQTSLYVLAHPGEGALESCRIVGHEETTLVRVLTTEVFRARVGVGAAEGACARSESQRSRRREGGDEGDQ